MDLEKLANIGKELGYSGEELQKFIERERGKEREERSRQRDENKERVAHEKELLEMQMHLEKMKKETLDQGPGAAALESFRSKAKVPKLPEFREDRDDMDAYLLRFERYATSQGWKKEDWSVSLSALLQGKGVSTYNRLSLADANNYDVLKGELLKAYHLTEDGFKDKFRSIRPEQNESAPQFLARLKDSLDRWIDLSKSPKSYEGIIDLLLKEQFTSSCAKDMAIFIKERRPKDAGEMALIASRYLDARGSWGLAGKSSTGGSQKGHSLLPGKKSFQTNPSTTSSGGRNDLGSQPRRCYLCNKVGHFANDCRNRSRILKAAGLQVSGAEQKTEHRCQGTFKPKGIGKHGSQSSASFCSACTCEKCLTKDVGACMVVSKDFHTERLLVDSVTLSCGHELPVMSAACSSHCVHKMPVTQGLIDGQLVKVLRDTGCSSVVVRRSLVPNSQLTGEFKTCVLIDGTVRKVPVAVIKVDTPYFEGEVTALCMNSPVYDLILGNIDGVRGPTDPNTNWKNMTTPCNQSEMTGAVETRGQKLVKEKELKELRVPKAMKEIVTADVLRQAQEKDTTLDKFRELAFSGDSKVTRNGGRSRFYIQKGILYRDFQSPKVNFNENLQQVVVPQQYRSHVMRLAHESVLGGHQGSQRTCDKVLSNFFWPGVTADVTRYCRSCDVCQRTLPKGRVSKVPLGSMPVIEIPFQRVAVDLVGPIHPCTERGHRYILTIVDYATRYPEAIPLRNIDTKTVAEALLDVYSRVGFPREILTDRGTQFTSDLMREISRLLSIKPLTTTPYHPACNGLVERFNATLKLMLKKMCEERPKDWDRYVNALLFAYRETPQASTGFSPFELLYGRAVRGPMSILKELWTDVVEEPETKTTYQYVLDLQDRLQKTCKLAKEELLKSQKKYKTYYNKRAKSRKFKVGDEVILLLPTDRNKLLMHWKGPFTVVEKVSDMDYKIDLGHNSKTFHANLLKKYYRREDDQPSTHVTAGLFEIVCTSVIEEEDDVSNGEEMSNERLLQIPSMKQTETVSDVHVCNDLSEEQRRQVDQLLYQYQGILTDVPGRTTLGYHDIKLTDAKPIRSRPYPVPHALRETVRQEVKMMLDLGVIEESNSPYASPLCIVKKKDGTNRSCCDMRKVNQVTVFDAEPTPLQDEIFAKLANDRYFTKIDLSKGYWQVPLTEEAKPITAFITHDGLYQFRVMPFGLVNSSATFNRIMRRMLRDVKGVDSFVDDILVHTVTWGEHIECLVEVFRRLGKANMTARPSKCFVGFDRVDFCGHIVGQGLLHPHPSKLAAIKDAPRPRTKTQLRSLLGLLNYYRCFIPNFAVVGAPLTDKTKKGEPTKIVWGESQELAFKSLKSKLTKSPILHLPDINKQFILRTDASEIGVGAVLLQEFDGEKFPIAYASKKLNGAQKNYSVIEKESLAVVWATQKFEPYLYGREFILETDHQPLLSMQRSKVANGRIMRWALALQPFRYRMVAIKGRDNVGADYLSRSMDE